ncbi:MAG: RluA family pseudouridine synthase [Gemmatimonadota bacterium]
MKREPPRRPDRPIEAGGDVVWLHVEDDTDERLDALVAERTRLSRSRVAALIASGEVTVNGGPAQKSYRPRAGDEIRVEIPPPPPIELAAQHLPIDVVYEDEHLVVVDKPHGMVVHPAPGHPDGTVVNALLGRYGDLSPIGLPRRPGVVHRLDRDTSGLMIVARREEAHQALSAALARREVGRGYLAAVWGRFEPERATIDRPMARHPGDRRRMAVVEGGRRAVTHVRWLERWPAADLLAIRLETGRTHQIRVHLADSGHPVVGDPVYGSGRERGMSGAGGQWAARFARRVGRLFLHAARLSFVHPVTGDELTFTSELPEPLAGALSWARETAS